MFLIAKKRILFIIFLHIQLIILFAISTSLSWASDSTKQPLYFSDVVELMLEQKQGIVLAENDYFDLACRGDCSSNFETLLVMWGDGEYKDKIELTFGDLTSKNIKEFYLEVQDWGSGYMNGMMYIANNTFPIQSDKDIWLEWYNSGYDDIELFEGDIEESLLFEFTAFHELSHTQNRFSYDNKFNKVFNENFADIGGVLALIHLEKYNDEKIINLLNYLITSRHNSFKTNPNNVHNTADSLRKLKSMVVSKTLNITDFQFDELDDFAFQIFKQSDLKNLW